MIIAFIISIIIVILDQLSKGMVVDAYPVNQTIIDHFLKFNLTYNTGAAFGTFDNATWILAVVSFVVSVALILYIIRKGSFKKNSALFTLSLSFILGGCVGNLIDRSLTAWGDLNGVVDFIDVYLFGWHFPGTFNLADAFLCVGVGLLIIDMLFIMDKRHIKEVLEEDEDGKDN